MGQHIQDIVILLAQSRAELMIVQVLSNISTNFACVSSLFVLSFTSEGCTEFMNGEQDLDTLRR